MSPYYQASHALIKRYGWDVEFKRTSILDGSCHTEEFKAKFPRGQIPALEDGETYVSEGQAVARYLLAKHEVDDTFWPKDDLARTKIEVQLAHEVANLRPAHGGILFQTVFMPVLFGKDVPEGEALEKLKSDFSAQLDHLTTWLKHNGGPFLTGENITFADFEVFTYVWQPIARGAFTLDGHPEVKAWHDLVAAEKGMAELIEEANAQFEEIKASKSG